MLDGDVGVAGMTSQGDDSATEERCMMKQVLRTGAICQY